MASVSQSPALARTPLCQLHARLGARMVPFAGYEMPVQYSSGIIAEHNWTRQNAGLFDVSHMGQATLVGPDHATTAAALEKLVPGDIRMLAPGRIRYTQLLNPSGGIIDDLMINRPLSPEKGSILGLVVNAARKEIDWAWIGVHLPADVRLFVASDLALIALQGPRASHVLSRHISAAEGLAFMSAVDAEFEGISCHLARSGYTGEDGFEISMPAEHAETLAKALLAEPEVKPVGLGARDSLRLEAGLCLYGHDIDESTSPVEADLVWSISKRRRSDADYIGAPRLLRELEKGAARKRVGILPEGRVPAREGTPILSPSGVAIGTVTSGGFGPTVNGPVAMGYVRSEAANPGEPVTLIVRDRPLAAEVVSLPFVPHNYKR